MDAAPQLETRAFEPAGLEQGPAPRRDSGRTLLVTVIYRLSEEGRKASLIAGGDGRALQEVKIAVPTSRFHLVSVDPEGVARLKLQPRYRLDVEQHVVREDTPPTYDAPPSIEDLLKDAARNHQLERAYHVEREESRTRHRETQFERHQKLAERFLADRAMRALEHPKPTPRQCYVAVNGRPILFDAKQHRDLARQVPPEAYRRFSEDLRTRTERNKDKRARELAVHEEKQRAIAEWVETRGTADQRQRHAAGVLPLEEVLEGMADEAFAAAGDRPRYMRDGVERLQAYLRQFRPYVEVRVTKSDLLVTSANAEEATNGQWALRHELQALLPDGEFTLRLHRLALKADPCAPTLSVFGLLVTRKVGPFMLRREYLVPDCDSLTRHNPS